MLGPVREELFTEHSRQRARRAILDAAAEIDMPTRQVQPLLDDLANGIPFMGIEAFRPAFAGEMTTLFDYLPQNALLVSIDPMAIAEEAVHVWNHYQKGRENFLEDGALSLPAEAHALNPNQVNARLAQFTQIRCHTLQMVDEVGLVDGSVDPVSFQIPRNTGLTNQLAQARGEKTPLRALAVWVRERVEHGMRVFIPCRQETQLDRSTAA